MSKCDTCARKQYGYLCDGCIHDPDNKDLYEPMTNADRIRGMSDEELVDVLREFATKPMQGSFLKWLQQPAEGE